MSIEDEVKYLRDEGIREVTLLGQNVNSYRDKEADSLWGDVTKHINSEGFAETFKLRDG